MADLANVRLTEDEYNSWTPISDALEAVAQVMGPHEGAQALAERLRAGLLTAAAENIVGARDPSDRVDFIKVPSQYWKAEWVANPRSMFWRTGQVTFTYRAPASMRDPEYKATYFGLRLDPAALAKLAPPVVPPAAQNIAAIRHAGGRPSWSGWENMWIEIAAQLWLGDLQPQKQKDIENAMLVIAERTEDGPKIAVIRTKARQLWALIKKDEN